MEPSRHFNEETGVYAVRESGFYVPPMLIYPRKRMKDSLSYGAPPGTVFHFQAKGWMESEMFCQWMRHFFSVVKPMPHEQVLLILDGHSSHTQSLAAIEIARKNGVVMLSLSSHSTHRMQRPDVTFFKLLNMFMSLASDAQPVCRRGHLGAPRIFTSHYNYNHEINNCKNMK
jgi:hypothetical protein